MRGDRRIVTWASKQHIWDYNDLQSFVSNWTDEGYTIHCLSPSARWYLLSITQFYGEWSKRYVNFPDESSKNQLFGEVMKGLQHMAGCETDFTRIADTLDALAQTMTEIRDGLNDPGQISIREQLAQIEAQLIGLNNTMQDVATDPQLIDQIEEALDGVGVILGAPSVGPSPIAP